MFDSCWSEFDSRRRQGKIQRPVREGGSGDQPRSPLNFAENLGQGLKVFLNEAAKAGDTITLALSALGNKFKAVLGDEIVGFDSGNVTLTLAEGQTEISFALLNTGDVDADQTLTLSATLQAADGSSNVVNTLAINFDANEETDNTPSTSHTINGDQDTNHVDQIDDTPANDLILAGDDGDFVFATNGGDNRIEGGIGNDVIGAGAGNDWLLGQADRDLMFGGMGDDHLFGEGETTLAQALLNGKQNTGNGQDGDWLFGMEGKDTIIAGAANDALEGGDGTDILVGGAGGDTINGGEGADTLSGYAGNDSLEGGEGDDRLYGGEGDAACESANESLWRRVA